MFPKYVSWFKVYVILPCVLFDLCVVVSGIMILSDIDGVRVD